jgi:hypothetical protein
MRLGFAYTTNRDIEYVGIRSGSTTLGKPYHQKRDISVKKPAKNVSAVPSRSDVSEILTVNNRCVDETPVRDGWRC